MDRFKRLKVAGIAAVGCLCLESGCAGNAPTHVAATIAPARVSAASPQVRHAIDTAVELDRHLYGGRTPVPGVLIGVWDGSGGSYVHGYGYADLSKKRPLTGADHFRIGSNTKTFVVSVILQLVDEKKLSLDDPIGHFAIGVNVPNAGNITIRQLCEMRSGLFEAFDSPQFEKMNITPTMKFDPRTIVGWAIQQKPYFPPGTAYKYSNTNYFILGLIIESVTHDSVGNEIRKRLIVPFGLSNTSYPDTQAMPDPWARGYGLDKNRDWEDVSNTIPVSMTGAAGNMISDMADIKRWITLYVTGKTSGPATHKALIDCIPTGSGNLAFGLGLGCSTGWYGYTGGLPGYNTANYYFPATGATIIAWVNTQQTQPIPGAANAIFRDVAHIMTPANTPFSGKGI